MTEPEQNLLQVVSRYVYIYKLEELQTSINNCILGCSYNQPCAGHDVIKDRIEKFEVIINKVFGLNSV